MGNFEGEEEGGVEFRIIAWGGWLLGLGGIGKCGQLEVEFRALFESGEN